MASTVRTRLNFSAITAFLYSPAGPIVGRVRELGRQVENAAKRMAPVDRGALRASIGMQITVNGTRIVARVGTGLEYALYVHKGTGLYGPRHRLIRPRRAKALTFKPRSGPRVFVKFSRGQKPNPFLVKALQAVSPWPVRINN